MMDSDNISISSTSTLTNSVSDLSELTVVKKRHYKKVRWAPIRGIPIERRLQMMAVLVWISLVFICVIGFILLAFFKFLWPVLIAYLTFMYFDKAPESGGRRIEQVRYWTIWKYFADYFPVKLIKEHNLDPSENYIFGYHPHGIISMGAFANFATEATGFSELFPGIVPSLLTLRSNFNLPLYRDFMLSLGIASVSRNSCESILNSGPGKSIVIVVGGAAESLYARPGINDLVLRKRLGFIRLAIKNQASLVPVFSFGENDIYDQVDNTQQGSTLLKYQHKMKAILGFTLPLFYARGVFNYDVGFVPFRHHIQTVVGKPIPVPKLSKDQIEPTKEQILNVQNLYIQELENIYHKYKDIYAKDRKRDLFITD